MTKDELKDYLKRVEATRPLKDKELRMLQRQLNTLPKLKNTIYEANLRLVVTVAQKYADRGTNLLSLINEGNTALEKAILGYQEEGNKTEPSEWYVLWVEHFILRKVVLEALPDLEKLIKDSLNTEKYDAYYLYFFLEQLMINALQNLQNKDQSTKTLLENCLLTTFSDSKLEQRMTNDNFLFKLPGFAEILKRLKPDVFKKIEDRR